MHYYQFNIGDYASHTSRLSQSEDLAYRRLLDLYYLSEQPFNECSKSVAREIGMIDQLDSVEYILSKFFVLQDGLWTQKRAEREIKAYQSKLESASKAGKASAKARKIKASEQAFNDCSTDVQPNIKQEPITNNQEPLTNSTHTHIDPDYQISDNMAKSAIQYWNDKQVSLIVEDVFKRFKAHYLSNNFLSHNWEVQWELWYMDEKTLLRGK